ncbi:hypothetical protein AKJ09_08107 [Labilithrix luteola]|uniref:Uncharacterized protein n=1 Tax=Labilithrix luteola TaxID=1391654 RepID=A0A0K1Q6V0_9BACT|nr:hypothetical protein AKJ09_08107 [Labilithrix luteola]
MACASQANTASSTTMTAADVSSPSVAESTESAPDSREAAPPANVTEAKLEELPGQVACRTSNRDDGTNELRLEWSGTSATGTMRTIAPSGEITTQRVNAERYRGAIIVDEPGQQDLVSHVAIVMPTNGKQAMRVGSGAYVTCE